ncbi:MAG: phosphomethylpyrimidine synthase ThiC [Planctomycetota bacterium]|nr:phosphomethylpyrimidine synthase ThiC [Planctomycetota bacterium]
MLLMEIAKSGKTDPRLQAAADAENIDINLLRRNIAAGKWVVPWANHDFPRDKPCAVGDGLSCKVNANFGTSPDRGDLDGELEKMRVAVAAGADAVMDLSTGGDLRAIRRQVRAECRVALGSVPMYEAGHLALARGETFRQMTAADMLKAVELHVQDKVDFITVHCGITRRAALWLREHPRLAGVVSRGGSLLARWMLVNGRENPLYERFDEVIDMCRATDCVLSLGDALRPGALADAGDRAQVEELYTLGELAERARQKNVQVIIEGPGHVPYNQIVAQMQMEKVACGGAPFYVLGPLVTDIAAGYDHIAGAIGGTLAATAGANFLCYVTPAEHLRLPEARDVREGVIAARIAAHAADIANGVPGARDRDDAMSRARKAGDWEKMFALALDPETARRSHESALPQKDDKVCTMCGEFCAMKGEECL